MPTEEEVRESLREVIDPELGINMIDLGLVYNIEAGEEVYIRMTLTTPGCPFHEIFREEVTKKVVDLGVEPENVEIELTFDPPWSQDKMSDQARAELGFI